MESVAKGVTPTLAFALGAYAVVIGYLAWRWFDNRAEARNQSLRWRVEGAERNSAQLLKALIAAKVITQEQATEAYRSGVVA